jgi:uncharacterized protein YaaN involved in tellurite resistance
MVLAMMVTGTAKASDPVACDPDRLKACEQTLKIGIDYIKSMDDQIKARDDRYQKLSSLNQELEKHVQQLDGELNQWYRKPEVVIPGTAFLSTILYLILTR